MGKILGKVGDAGRASADVTYLPPAPPKAPTTPKYVNNNRTVLE